MERKQIFLRDDSMYPSDLTQAEWQKVAPLVEREKRRGNPGKYGKRDIINAILYVHKSGIPWRMMPKTFPPWDSVYDYYRRWRKSGLWKQMLVLLNLNRGNKRIGWRKTSDNIA